MFRQKEDKLSKYPKGVLCQCNIKLAHAHIWLNKDAKSPSFVSKEAGTKLIKQGVESGFISEADRSRLEDEVGQLTLPETHQDAIDSLSDKTKRQLDVIGRMFRTGKVVGDIVREINSGFNDRDESGAGHA